MDAIPSFDSNEVHRSGFAMASFGGDARLIVWFFDKPLLNGLKSRDQNIAIYENVPHVHIQQPGERDCLERPVNNEDVARFPKQWTAYQQKQHAEMDGTPLTILFPTNQALVETFRHNNVLTVQQLANLNDTQIQNVGMGGREFVAKAKAFLDGADGSKNLNALSDEVEAMKVQMASLMDRNKALENALEQSGGEVPAVKRRGRPPGSKTIKENNDGSNE